RADRAFARSAVASPTQRADRPFQISHYEINERWQELAVVLEGREIGSVYDPRIHDTANPYRSPEELADELEKLAHLEHVLALMYLYARYSVLQPEEVTVADSWPTLKEDVYFVRREILITAVSEMQHMRWVNQLLWELAEAGLIKRRPPVVEPGREIPGAGPLSTRPAELMPLLPAVLKTFVDVELPSGYIDGRYARVVATLRSGYPSSLYQLASRIVTDGEEHYSRFRRVQQTLNRYGKYTPYLRDIELGSPADPNVATALAIYAKIKSSLRAAYESGDLEQAADVVRARELMHKLDEAAEALARKGVGVPFFPQK
ncbi:MAG TPA: ferritin-like domain-containing protein, partial [Sorangium sp.]|nr:ferritin-like domain-containing protein [Sorangium sp.]